MTYALHGQKGTGSVRAGTFLCTVYFMGLMGDKQSRAGSLCDHVFPFMTTDGEKIS